MLGGVTACSNGSDDDGGVTIKLKGAFFEEGDENTPWVYCTEELKEKTESGIWEGEITSVNSNGWDNFGLEINGTWYGAEESLSGNNYTDAKLVKNSSTNFWLVTNKGGKTKVTVNLNTMTITAVDASQTTDNPDDDEAIEFSFNYEASTISTTATSITVTVADITGTATDQWFWADTDGDKGDNLVSSKLEDGKDVYKLDITDAKKIAHIKKNGLTIKGAKGLSATVTVTTTESTTTPPTDGDDEKKEENNTTTMPTAVVLKSKIDGSNWTDVSMTKSATDGIWTCQLTVSNQWPNFNVKATIGGKNIWYKGASGDGTEVTLGSDPAKMTTGEEGDKDNLYCNVGEKYNGAQILVTVDFTGTEPSIKITLDKEGTVAEAKKPLVTSLPITDISLSDITTTLPGILVAQGSVFSDVDESKTITVTITCNAWDTINSDDNSWFHCNFNGENTDDWGGFNKD